MPTVRCGAHNSERGCNILRRRALYVWLSEWSTLCRRSLLCPGILLEFDRMRRMSVWTVYLVELCNDILPRVSRWNICGLAWPKQLPALRRRRFEPTGTGHMPFHSHDMSYRDICCSCSIRLRTMSDWHVQRSERPIGMQSLSCRFLWELLR